MRAGSQYEPLDLHTPVGVESGFVLDVNIAPLRRSGTMRPEQRRRRAERDARLGWPEPRARERRGCPPVESGPITPQAYTLRSVVYLTV